MPWTAAAVIGAAGVGAWGASEAADKQVGASERGFALTQEMFDQIRGDLSPFTAAGKDTLPFIKSMLGIGAEGGMNPDQIMAMLEKLPGYQFVKQQGLNAVMNQFGAKGLGFSGASAKGVADWVTGLADNTYGTQLNRLLGVAQMGQNSAAQTGAFGMQAAGQMNENLLFGGNAAAAGIMGGANAIGGGLNNLVQMQMLNKILKQGGYTGLYGNSPNYDGFTFSEPGGP